MELPFYAALRGLSLKEKKQICVFLYNSSLSYLWLSMWSKILLPTSYVKTRQWGFSCLLVFMFGTLSPSRAPGRDFVQNKRPQWAALRGVCGKQGGRQSYRRRDLIGRGWLPGNHTERTIETTTAAGGKGQMAACSKETEGRHLALQRSVGFDYFWPQYK